MLNEFLDPIREKRNDFAKQPNLVKEILEQGRIKTQRKAAETLALVKQAMRIDYHL
jgi:tryptophanyl-tRNA synthetase